MICLYWHWRGWQLVEFRKSYIGRKLLAWWPGQIQVISIYSMKRNFKIFSTFNVDMNQSVLHYSKKQSLTLITFLSCSLFIPLNYILSKCDLLFKKATKQHTWCGPRHSYMQVFRVSLPQVLALSDHCDGDIKDESEGDPAAAAVDDSDVPWRR